MLLSWPPSRLCRPRRVKVRLECIFTDGVQAIRPLATTAARVPLQALVSRDLDDVSTKLPATRLLSDALSPAEAGAALQTQDRGCRDGGFLAGRRHPGRPEGAVGTDAQRLRLGARAADRRHGGRAGRSGSGNASLVRCPHAHCDQRIVGRTRSDSARHRSICEVGRRPPFDPAIGCDKYFLRLALDCAGLQRAIRTDDPCLRGGTGRPRGPLYACRSRWPRRPLGALVPFWAGRPRWAGISLGSRPTFAATRRNE
jgi:hypothetical protein